MYTTIIDSRPVAVSDVLETAQGISDAGKGYLLMLFAKGRWDGVSPVTARPATAEEAALWRQHVSLFGFETGRSTIGIPDDAEQAANTAERVLQIEADPNRFDENFKRMIASIGWSGRPPQQAEIDPDELDEEQILIEREEQQFMNRLEHRR
jgi:hypothetical protein